VLKVLVAENADLSGSEKAGCHEHLVLTLDHVLAESETQPFDQRPPDQLVRSERAPDAVPEDVSITDGFSRTWVWIWPADPTDTYRYDVGVLSIRNLDEPPQRIQTKEVVGIMAEDIRPGGNGQGAVAASAGTSGVWLPEDLDVPSFALKLTQIAPGIVG
jgi:hypothetical protein